MKYNNWCLGLLTLAMCTQRASIAVGNICLGFSILMFLLHLYQRYQRGGSLKLPPEYQIYFNIYGIFMLFLLPSVFFAGDIVISFKYLIGIFGYRIMPFVMLLYTECDNKYIKRCLLIFVAYIAFDGVVTFIEMLIKNGARAEGLGDGLLRHASIMATVFPVALILWLDDRIVFPGKRYFILFVIGIILGFGGNQSRSGWLGGISILPFVFYKYFSLQSKKMWAILLLLCCLAGIIYTSPKYHHRFQSIANITTDRSNGDRVEAWKSAWKMVLDRPLIGYGINQGHQIYLNQYRSKAETQGLPHFHSSHVEVAVGTGFIGFIGYIFFWCFMFWKHRKFENTYIMMIFCVCFAFNVVGSFDYTIDLFASFTTLWFVLGSLVRLAYPKEDASIKQFKQKYVDNKAFES